MVTPISYYTKRLIMRFSCEHHAHFSFDTQDGALSMPSALMARHPVQRVRHEKVSDEGATLCTVGDTASVALNQEYHTVKNAWLESKLTMIRCVDINKTSSAALTEFPSVVFPPLSVLPMLPFHILQHCSTSTCRKPLPPLSWPA